MTLAGGRPISVCRMSYGPPLIAGHPLIKLAVDQPEILHLEDGWLPLCIQPVRLNIYV